MSTWQRIGIGVGGTIGLMAVGLVYTRVFIGTLMPMIDTASRWATGVVWAERIVPLVLVMLLLALWAWVVAGAIQEERTVDRRRLRR